MDVEFFIHGVPKGESFWGRSEEKNFLSQFYDGKTDVEKMYIYSRSLNNVKYVYYTFIISNTIDVNGRSGGYFGMTLRLNAYCLDYSAMYQVLSLVYRNHMIGSILKVNNGKVQYNIGDFKNADASLGDIQERIFKLIQISFGKHSFAVIPQTMANGGSNVGTINLYDYTEEEVQALVSRYSRIALSPYYSSKKICELKNGYEKQMNSFQKQCNQQIMQERETASKDKESLVRKVQDMTSTNASLQNDLTGKNEMITNLQNQVKQLRADIHQQGKLRKLEGVVAEIKTPLTKLAAILEEIAPVEETKKTKAVSSIVPKEKNTHSEKSSFWTFLHRIFTLALLVLILGVMGVTCVLGYQLKDRMNSMTGKVECLQKQYKQVESEQQAIFKVLSKNNSNLENGQSNASGGEGR